MPIARIVTGSRGSRRTVVAHALQDAGMCAARTDGRVSRTARAVVCVVPSSGLVAANAGLVRGLVTEAAHGQAVVIDLTDADDIDGDGLAALLALIADVRGIRGTVAIAAEGALARQLRFVGVERLALMCSSAALALAAITPGR